MIQGWSIGDDPWEYLKQWLCYENCHSLDEFGRRRPLAASVYSNKSCYKNKLAAKVFVNLNTVKAAIHQGDR
jgi:hypothetical protein